MAAHEAEYGVQSMCQALGVGRSGYYAWRKRATSLREKRDRELVGHIRAAYINSRKTYGSPRIHAALQRQGVLCGRNRVAKLMRLHGITARKRSRRFPVTTQRQPGALPAPNLLNQDFSATESNQKWVTDITYIDTAEGWLYLAPVLDLFSRQVVGWAMADHSQASLVESALRMALARRHPQPGFLHHSDQGSQYTSFTYQLQLLAHHCRISMSRVGNCYDNAVMESFFATLKTECATGQFASQAQARRAIFEYIEVWYNRQRLHSSLGYLSPAEFEKLSGK
ncbi:MAG: IS3 family transposase [Anaerolineales bacterium]